MNYTNSYFGGLQFILNIINVLYNIISRIFLYLKNLSYVYYYCSNRIEPTEILFPLKISSVSSIPIKIVGFSLGLLSKLPLAKGKKKSFKRTARIRETHNAKPTNLRGLHTKYNVHMFERLHFSALLLPFYIIAFDRPTIAILYFVIELSEIFQTQNRTKTWSSINYTT